MASTSDRRWVRGSGGAIPRRSTRLLRLARGRRKQWRTTAKALKDPDMDQVAVEARLHELKEAGLIEIHERRNRRGDFEPYEWRLTDKGRRRVEDVDRTRSLEARLAAFLEETRAASDHPVLGSINAWLKVRGVDNETPSRILMAIGEALLAGQMPTERTVSLSAFGNTKVVRIASYPEAVGEALGCAPEQVVRRAGQAVLAYGPFSFQIRGRCIDGEWSVPWLALTEETVEEMTALETTGDCVLTIENLTAFEEEIRAGLPPGAIALYTGGFPGALEITLLNRFRRAGIERFAHWGDLDLGGLRILKYLEDTLKKEITPYRMTPALLDTLPTAPLTAADRQGLKAWLEAPDTPLKTLAAAMLEQNKKAEQEGWFLTNGRGVGPSGIYRP